ncbi:hypothetical protein ACODNH_05355 [Haloarcula sp. NS06]|uniref:hypothetical protein n=1 Tax=Haloarcula sp. NS06 TaxID=3409688 RepID=UPI003DA702A8
MTWQTSRSPSSSTSSSPPTRSARRSTSASRGRRPTWLRQSLLDGVEETMVGAQGNLVYQSVQQAHNAIDSYAGQQGYDLEFFSETFAGVDFTRDRMSIHVEWSWQGDLPMFYEFGVSPHTIEGDPLLHFFWEEADQWIQTESVEWGSETGGIPESRAVRDSLNWLRREVGQG